MYYNTNVRILEVYSPAIAICLLYAYKVTQFISSKGLIALKSHTSINHFHTGTTGIPPSVPSSSYVIRRHFSHSLPFS